MSTLPRSMVRSLLSLLLFSPGGLFLSVYAQERGRLLPEFDLPEFVITGEESIELPALSKEELPIDKGLDLSKRVPDPAERSESTPFGIGAPAVAPREPFPTFSSRVIGGYATHVAPFADVSVGTSVRTFDIGLRGSYRSIGDYVEFARSRSWRAGGTGRVKLAEAMQNPAFSVLRIELDGRGNTYRFHGSSTPSLSRTVNGFGGTIGVEYDQAVRTQFLARASMNALTIDDATRSSETQFGLESRFSSALGPFEAMLAGRGLLSSVSQPDHSFHPHSGEVRMGLSSGSGNRHTLSSRLSVRWDVGLAFFGARNSDGSTVGRIYPHARISMALSRDLSVFARYHPALVPSNLASVLAENPYVGNRIPIFHIDEKHNILVGLSWNEGRTFQLQSQAVHRRIAMYPIVVDSSYSGVWNASYLRRVTISSLSGEVRYAPSGNVSVSGGVIFRVSEADEISGKIPYVPSYTMSGSADVHLGERFLIGIGGEVHGPRRHVTVLATGFESVKLGVNISLHTRLEYKLTNNFRIFLQGENLLDRNNAYWKGYREPPLNIGFGIIIQW